MPSKTTRSNRWSAGSCQRLLVSGLVGVAGVVGLAQSSPDLRVRAARAPQIELRAPGAFDAAAEQARHAARYRIDATVLFPLFSIRIAHRDDVGFATVGVQDLRETSGMDVRTYELFAASFPERARGLNRTGFFREVGGRGHDGPQWTAHFGALSSNPETRRSEVALDGDESRQSYTVLDGYTNRMSSTNRDVRLDLLGSWTSSGGFYRRLLPVWGVTDPDAELRTRPQDEVRGLQPVGFLGIVERALSDVANTVGRGASPRRLRYPFVHKAVPMFLELTGHRVDDGRRRRYEEAGVVSLGATVHRLDFRILDGDANRVQSFRVWTEFRDLHAGPGSSPPLPLGFVFKAKSFLELEGVRVSATRPE